MSFGTSAFFGLDLNDDYFMRATRVMRNGFYTPAQDWESIL